MRLVQRAKFDRTATFVVRRLFKFNGKDYGPGDVFPKEESETDRLRTLYEGKYLEQVAPVMVPKEVLNSSAKANPDVIQNVPNRKDELLAYYEKITGKKADKRWKLETLKAKIEKALE